MNKIIKRILNISIKIICMTFLIILVIYSGLWIFVIKSVPEELKEQYDNSIILDITDSQYQIIWFVLTENRNYRFIWYPFIIEIFFRERNDNLDNYISILINSNEKYRKPYRMQGWNIEYGLSRYIRSDNNYKKCLSLLITQVNMGNNIYGLENASEHYYNKKIDDLTEKELVSLLLLSKSPSLYKIGETFTETKTNEILEKYRN
jgi:membrane carboxypeptidase/penicillin-binding protein PbpC